MSTSTAARSQHSRLLAPLAGDLERISQGRHHDPHHILGPHEREDSWTVLAYLPAVRQARIDRRHTLTRLGDSDFFFWTGRQQNLPQPYRLSWIDSQGRVGERYDPYCFAPSITPADLAMFASGKHVEAWRLMGAHAAVFGGVQGLRFAVWAPNAERVSVVGPFCDWDGRRFPMRVLGSSGVWEIFIPGLPVGEIYKFEIRSRSGSLQLKSDPYGRQSEARPATASIVAADDSYEWQDAPWLAARARRDWLHAPMSIYEVHAGSWKRNMDGSFMSYRQLAHELIPYVQRLGFTHIELLPITEHPLDDSWGYQTTGFFSPTARFGPPEDLKYFIDQCHREGIAVLLDWVPGHFPRDAHGLARFDGTALYEYEDPLKGEHLEWGTMVFNYERFEVRSFLLSSACYWLEEFHFDGLRVDAVASMLYLDYARKGEFVPNRYGGNHNLEAIDFLRELNATTHARSPGTVVIAEESTSWAMVSRPTDVGGLGFSMKWNMGWMHDTLSYIKENPVHRSYNHNKLTFGMMYAYTENFVLPLSHDEVVHMKASLLGRMPGDRWQQLANLRLLFTYMWTIPGKKLLFMGGEFAQPWEWDFRQSLPWFLTDYPEHSGVQRLVGDLNRLYVSEPALHRFEFEPQGFEWIDCNDASQSTLTYIRRDGARALVVALNFTPVPREGYRVGVPHGGWWRQVFNSDSEYYGGGNVGNLTLEAVQEPHMGQPWSLQVLLPPLAGVILAPA